MGLGRLQHSQGLELEGVGRLLALVAAAHPQALKQTDRLSGCCGMAHAVEQTALLSWVTRQGCYYTKTAPGPETHRQVVRLLWHGPRCGANSIIKLGDKAGLLLHKDSPRH